MGKTLVNLKIAMIMRGLVVTHGGESVSQPPLMYKLFFILACGNLRSWLPANGASDGSSSKF